jgi:hypothetical protein
MEAALHIIRWCTNADVEGLKIDFIDPKGKTPLLFCEINATDKNNEDTMLFYGHWDK